MELHTHIYDLYSKIGSDIVETDRLRCICEKGYDKKTGSFSVTLEIAVMDFIGEDDYGLVFSTSA